MRRWWSPVVLLLATLLAWWLWPGEEGETSAPIAGNESSSLANEGALPEALKPSAWNAPIQQRGERLGATPTIEDGEPLEGRVVMESGEPVSGAEVSIRAGRRWRKTTTDEPMTQRQRGR